ncbi:MULTISPECIES: hypothetical protein [Methylorubrum]|uniref:hypothetical protein n=1 Tax=Methylorubrum TaxID=2282523 RepID=UPI00209F621B|nr:MULTISPECIES: hypothetical protein [Methylorubrum]MCP1551665.1 hypothetical protein [Methylorubrum zatmanii]MCP1556593.1 hypothetical protein [Methylorubrum extorquens]MCP1582000.1 hypothetical protein [Methylorubrum extorquens]
MASLNLRAALKRDPNRLTLKQRAAALKATAGRVFRRRPVAVAPAAEGADPRLVAMVAELLEARRKLNDPAIPDGPEIDAVAERETHLCLEIHRFPAQSIHDMRAKLPLLREEAEDMARRWDGRRVPFEESLPGTAWTSLLRDIEHLAGVGPKTDIAPDPILAAIEASKAAHAVRDAWEQRFNGGTKPSAADFAEEEHLNGAQFAAHEAALSTVPTSAAGRLALLEYLRWQMGLFGMADGSPPDAHSEFWPDAYKALKAALAFEADPQAHQSAGVSNVDVKASSGSAERDLSKEAFDYARGLDLSGVSYGALCRLYDVFLSAHTLLSPHEDEAAFTSGKVGNFRVLSTAGLVVEAEINRLGCLRDTVVMEMERRKPEDRTDNRMRLEVVIAHRMRSEGDISDALLAEYAEARRA